MFEDSKITKLKKDQFVEAESVAYLIKDEQKRKLTFINTCALFAFKNYIEKNKYKQEPVTNMNLFRVPIIAEKYGISDLYLGDVRIDVRVSLDGNVFPIPVCHVKNGLAPDFYVVYKRTKNPLKCEAVGYIKKEDLIFDSQDKEYYYISNSILNPIEDLKKDIDSIQKEEKTFYETEHKIASENIGAFLDGELDNVKSLDLIEHLLLCKECRSWFVEYSFLEDVLIAVKHYPDLKDDLENVIKEQETSDETNETEKSEEEPAENIETLDIETPVIPVVAPIEEETPSIELDADFSDDSIQVEDDIPVQNEDGLVIDTDETEAEDGFVDLSESELTFDDEIPLDETNDEELIIEESHETDENSEPEDEYIIKENEESTQIPVEEEQTSEIDGSDFVLDEGDIQPDEPQIVEEEIKTDENTFADDFIEDLPVQNSVFDDEPPINIEESAEKSETSASDIDIAFDDEIKIPTVETEAFVNPEEQAVELDIVSQDDDSTISLSDILVDETQVEPEVKENLQNDEELQNILNSEPSQPQEESISIDTNWNELFASNSGTTQAQPEENSLVPEVPVSELTETSYTNENIETLYDKSSDENVEQAIPEDLIETTIEQTSEKEKKSKNVVVVAASIVILAAVCTGGFFMANHFIGESSKPSNETSFDKRRPDGPVSNDMNRSMTNAFSDVNQTLNVTKLSWNINKTANQTPELKEYMMTVGKMISDEIDNNIMSVQGYIAENPMKISILIDKKGEVKNIKVSDSCGAEEVDNMLLNSTKTVIEKNAPSMYGISGENIKLTLVVNF